ncbi:MAG: ribonuclease-3 [Planctomycetota bacterium]|jgi:ribonuclease-3
MPPIDHDFSDNGLLKLAMTHSSTGKSRDNERLEFLGDAVLDLIVAEQLFLDHPERNEGDLTEFKAEVVSRKTLAEAARHLRLDEEVNVGSGMKGRALPRSVQANLYEALLGAIYLDAGLEVSRAYVLQTLQEPLSRPSHQVSPENPKQRLQQMCQRIWGAPPTYRTIQEHGRSHARAFLVIAKVGEQAFPSAWGRTLKEAERWAAHEALLILDQREES